MNNQLEKDAVEHVSERLGESSPERTLVTFCMSTYKRPEFLRKQLETIAQQRFPHFQVVVSDNDKGASGRAVVEVFNDPRVVYFLNEENLGMIRSFNRSIARAKTEYIVMITDDDPVYPDMLHDFFGVVNEHPGFPIYCGCKRTGKEEGQIEIFDSRNFVFQLLNSKLTSNFLWSSCLLRRQTALDIGGLPDYGSPHLADHAMLAICSKYGGGVMINRMYSELSFHDTNFSKSNFKLYYSGCLAFYKCITGAFEESYYRKGRENALVIHLQRWFIDNAFTLKKFFAHTSKNDVVYKQATENISAILGLPFMRSVYPRYLFKSLMFYLKYPFYYLKILK